MSFLEVTRRRQAKPKRLSNGISSPSLSLSFLMLWWRWFLLFSLGVLSKLRLFMKKYLFLILAFSAPLITYAIGGDIEQPNGTIEFTNIGQLIAKLISYAIGIAGVLWVIGITWWGIQMILSTGDDEKLKKWRFIMIYSIVWVIVAGLAYSIISIVGNLKIG